MKNITNDIQNIELTTQFGGYFSSYDKTKIAPNVLVGGSKNVYKKINGNIGVRDGLKRRGEANSTFSAVSSEFVYRTSWGDTLPLWVADGELQVEIETSDGVFEWFTLMDTDETRWVFDIWWDNTLKKNKVVAVNGTDNEYSWAGGVAQVASATASTITKTGSATWTEDHFETPSSPAGDSTTQFDISNPSGTTFRYTFDGTGTDPLISATTAPIGSYVYLAAQNFNAANNGVFQVTGSGSNYFEVTNASGVTESNKTVGTGSVYIYFKNFVVANGVQYAYSGTGASTTLTGVLPNPSALTATTYVFSPVVTYLNKPADGFNADFIKVVNNRAFIGSYTSQLVYISSSTDFTNFTIPGSIIPGSPNLLTLDGTGKGIAVRQGNAHVSFGTDGWVEVTFPTYTNASGVLLEQITPILKPVQALGAALAHEFIANNGDNFVYLAQDQQLRYFGGANTAFTTVYPALSQEVYTELQEEDFDGGGIKIISDRTYITAPNTGNVWIYQTRQSISPEGVVVAERLWYPPFVLNATRIDEIDGQVVAFSNANPQVYYVWDTMQWFDDSPSDESLPYTCIAAFPYLSANENRQLVQNFQRLYTEGYIGTGSPLYALINYDYLGATAQYSAPVNTTMRPSTLYQTSAPSIGETIIGNKPIGDVISSGGMIGYPKFRSINMFSPANCFEYQKIYFSDSTDSRWEILATGTDARLAEVEPVQIINK
jgi:hypothetical protein